MSERRAIEVDEDTIMVFTEEAHELITLSEQEDEEKDQEGSEE